MSVGKGEDASDGGGSDDYDDDEEDEDEYHSNNNNGNHGNNNSNTNVVTVTPKEPERRFPLENPASSQQNVSRIPPPQVPPHQNLGNVASRQQQKHQQAQERINSHQIQNKLPKDAGSSMYFFNVAAAHGDIAAKSGSNNVQHRDPDPAMTNYYTSLLTSFPGATTSFRNIDPGHDQDRRNKGFQTAEQSLRQILSDPISGELMDDAIIFPCGHSFGPAGVQRIQETHACFICQVPTRLDTGSTNFALRLAVQAFRNDRGIPKPGSSRAAKRRRDPDGTGETFEGNRNKGVQFPYVVSDRVLIKGNKRTPERFVGKEAIITTQCLNGWYLVRTIDNGESVRLQYRSLQKIEGDGTSWHQEQAAAAAEFESVDLSAQNS